MFPNVGLPEFLIVMVIAVLMFGKRLPEVARSLGKGVIEFKKGLSGISDELDISGPPERSSWRSEDHGTQSGASTSEVYSDASVPKFELPGEASAPAAPASATGGETVLHESELPRD